MEYSKDSSRGKHRRGSSRERDRDTHRRSESRVNTREPRTVLVEEDYRDYDDALPKSPKFRDERRPSIEHKVVRESSQPYNDQPSVSREAGGSSSAYHKSYETRRPPSRYYSDKGRRGNEDIQQHVSKDIRGESSSLVETFGDLGLGDKDVNYALSSQSPRDSSSYITRDFGPHQTRPSKPVHYSRDPDPSSHEYIGYYIHNNEDFPSSSYHQTPANDPMPDRSPHLTATGTSQPGSTASRHYSTSTAEPPPLPAPSAYPSSQQVSSPTDIGKQNKLPPKGKPKGQQKLDASFFVRKTDYKKFFRVGKVFMTLWSEQFGSNAGHGSFVSDVIYGEKVFSKVRRFIVIREAADKRSASCLPITSYGGNGLDKIGIELPEHGFIYSNKEPDYVSGLCSKALRVILSPKAPDLAHPSLVNYGKVHNVESNWKVKEVGDLESESKKALLRYFRRVFRLEDDSDLPEAEMTPRVKDAVLAHVGAGVSDYSSAPTSRINQSVTTVPPHFNAIPATEGYPPRIYTSARDDTESTMYRQSSSSAAQGSSFPTPASRQYETNTYQSTNEGTPSYSKYPVSYAPSHTASTPSYYGAGQSSGSYYYPSETHGSGGNNYQNYDSRQLQQAWRPADPISNPGTNDGYSYYAGQYASQATNSTYQEPRRPYGYPGEGNSNPLPLRSSEYTEAAIRDDNFEPEIDLPSMGEAAATLRERKRRDSKTAESSHRRRRDDQRRR